MLLALLAVAGVLGLLVGAFVAIVALAHRLEPSDE